MPTAETHKLMQQAVKKHQQGDLAEAEKTYRLVLRGEPENADALHLLGLIAHQVGQHMAAIDLIGRAIQLKPKTAEFYVNIGQVWRSLGNLDNAAQAQMAAVTIAPMLPEAHNNLGTIFKDQGKFAEALAALERAITLRPMYAEAYNNIGNVYERLGEYDKAVASYEKSLQLQPQSPEGHNNLANALVRQGKLTEAIAACRKAIELRPEMPQPHNNLANALRSQGDPTAAIAEYLRATELDANSPQTHSNLLLAMNYDSTLTPEAVFAEHRRFSQRFEVTQKQKSSWRPTPADMNKGQLRVGFVSPDLRLHAVAHFLEKVVELHDKAKVHLTCYSDVVRPDAVTERLRSFSDAWRDISTMDHERAANLIKGDKIDILVDLAGHTNHNRMPMFALCPAPVQASWLGYPNTTGLDAMDFFISDANADPAGPGDRLFVEQVLRLPNAALCYRAPDGAPELAPLPALRNKHITFGSFNEFAKINAQVAGTWSRVLKAAPNSVLVVKSQSMADAGARKKLASMFQASGIQPARIRALDWPETRMAHLAAYGQIDIALDPFPFNGATTTCEALWMGVPVVVLAGDMHASRMGVTILSNVGLAALVAKDVDAYVATAVKLAGDVERLSKIRGVMRKKMTGSALMNHQAFTRDLEGVFEGMWNAFASGALQQRRAQVAAR